MNVLIDHITPNPGAVTGIATYTWCIAAALGRQPGHLVYLRTNANPEIVPAHVRDAMAEIFFHPTPQNETLAVLSRGLTLPGLVKKLKADIVFSPTPVGPFVAGVTRVSVVHDLYRVTHPQMQSRARRLQWNAMFPASLAAATAVISVSQATCDILVRHYPRVRDKVSVVHEAAPLAPEVPLTVRPAVQDYALMVANVMPTKNLKAFYDAMMILHASGFKGRFVLVGNDPSGEGRAFCATHPEIDFRILEGRTPAQLSALYSGARCYVNTSVTEGFCLPVLEAQSFGVPVICSDLPVLREVGGPAALFFDPHDPDTLAGHIERIFSDAGLAAERSNASLKNAAKFSWDRAARETFAVFERASRGSPRNSS
jgi:glycosyltransferase involved in cell wall biosynthesis